MKLKVRTTLKTKKPITYIDNQKTITVVVCCSLTVVYPVRGRSLNCISLIFFRLFFFFHFVFVLHSDFRLKIFIGSYFSCAQHFSINFKNLTYLIWYKKPSKINILHKKKETRKEKISRRK